MKHLLIAVMLLPLVAAPALALFGSNTIMMTSVAPPASGTVACVIGPNFSGTIPAAAQAAGFTTCLANYDFTTSAYATPSTYIDCLGASTPQFYNAFPGISPIAGCGFSIGADPSGPSQVLINSYTRSAACASASTCQQALMTANSNMTTIAASFPNAYYEEVYRVTPTWSCTSGGSAGCANPMSSFWSWGSAGTSNGGNDELDFIETYGANLGNEYDAAWHNASSSSAAFFWQGATANLGSGYDPTQYNTYAMLVTTDNATSKWACSIINGVVISKCLTPSINATSYNARRVLTSNNGTSTDSTNNIISGFTSVTKYIQHIRVFGCAGGGVNSSGGNCIGSTLSGNGANGVLTYWH